MSAVLVAVVGLLALRSLVRWYEPQLAFFPMRGEDATPASYGVPYTPLTVTTADGVTLRVWHLPATMPRAQIVYFHGNGGNLSLWADILVALSRRGLDVVAFDYRGYGQSSGTPSERGLYQDVTAIVQFVHEQRRVAGVPLIYWGRSLGATMAAYAATVRQPAGLILEAGFPSMRSIVASNPVFAMLARFSSFEFATVRWMSRTRAPALVLHGDADTVIPYRLGRELYAEIPGPKTFVTIHGGDHNDTAPADPESYWRGVDQFIAAL